MLHARPAVFFDRGDTININADLPAEAFVRIMPGVVGLLERL